MKSPDEDLEGIGASYKALTNLRREDCRRSQHAGGPRSEFTAVKGLAQKEMISPVFRGMNA